MPDYQKMYFQLFNSLTDAICILQEAQQNAEKIFLDEDYAKSTIIKPFPKTRE
ncbi:hypothetical protein U6B65_11205 [Oscillospiraceae bacterium MB08-C2-2]|nr:hypothetical protein U6B65_11205 [Oscillospiraceae bacterium MB08-C2-2]